jgi:hypothetical protein
MPGLNQTGPSGRGPMTGRGRGLCNVGRPVYTTGVTDNAGLGRGMRFGRGFMGDPGPEMRPYRGRGLGRRRMAFQETYPQDTQAEIDRLNLQAGSLRRELDAINQRLSEMEKSE